MNMYMRNNAFALRLWKLLLENNIDVKTFSANTNISYRKAEAFLYGAKMPNFNILCRIADYFGVSIDWLLGRSDKYWL